MILALALAALRALQPPPLTFAPAGVLLAQPKPDPSTLPEIRHEHARRNNEGHHPPGKQ